MQKVIYVILFCVVSSFIVAQPPARKHPISLPELNQMNSLHESRLAFDVYRLQNDISKKGGWKWAKRQEHELLKRVDTEGKMPSGEVYLDALTHIENMRQTNTQARVADPGWSPIGPFANDKTKNLGRINCIAFHPTDALTYYVGFGQGGIWKTTNGGTSYTPLTDNLPMLRISGIAIDPNNPETIYATLGDMAYIGYDLYTADRKRASHYGIGLYKSTDGGKTWVATSLSFKQSDFTGSLLSHVLVNSKNSQEVVVTSTTGIYKSKDGGVTWSKKYNDIADDLDQDPSNPLVLYAAGMYVNTVKLGKANILKSTDFGETWTEISTGLNLSNAQRIEVAVSPVNTNYLYAVACDYSSVFQGFYRSKDGGKTWTTEGTRAMGTYNLLGDGYRLVYPNYATEADDYGYGQGLYDLTILADPTNAEKIYVGGLTPFISENGGKTWTVESIYGITTHPDIHFLAYNPLNKLFYNCNDGGLFTTANIVSLQKTIWKSAMQGINATSFYRLSSSNINDDLAAGAQDNNTSMRRNGTWEILSGGDGMECLVYPDDKPWVYTSYQYGNIGIYIKSSSGNLDSANTVFTPGRYGEISEWTTPFIFDATNKNVIIGAGNVYKVPVGYNFVAVKKISNFSNNPSFAAPNQSTALAQNTKDPNTIYVAKMAHPTLKIPSELYKTSDYGTTWENIATGLPTEYYISYIATDNQKPANRLWLTMSNFVEGQKVFTTNDGGKTWTNVSYNLPNISANCITYDEQTGIVYVGMDVGVYYLLPNTKTWQPFNTNLPNVIVNELEINPRTRKLMAATFGRGLWASDVLVITETDPIYFADVQISPNPTEGLMKITAINMTANHSIALKLVDVLGRTTYQAEANAEELQQGKTIDLNGQVSGLYFLQLVDGLKTKVVKVLVK